MRLLDASLAEGAVATELVRWLAPRVGAARCPPRRGHSAGASGRRYGGWWSGADRPGGGAARHRREAGQRAHALAGRACARTARARCPLHAGARSSASCSSCSRPWWRASACANCASASAITDAVMRGLVDRGLARIGEAERIRDPFAGVGGTPPPERPTPGQQAAIAAIDALGPGEAALLQGVTGSGKTFVYLEAVQRALAAGRGAIVLVPEIALTPQTVSRFRGVFGDQVAVLHSGLSDGERADAWRLLRRGERRVAVGARSAIFAPVRDLGLIVIDEEHETSYKNGEAPRYHARDVAMVRARLERRARRARQCHAIARVARAAGKSLAAAAPAESHRGAAHAAGRARGPAARRARAGGGTGALVGGARRRARCRPREPGAGAAAAQPAGIRRPSCSATSCAAVVRLPELQHRTHGASRRPRACGVTTAIIASRCRPPAHSAAARCRWRAASARSSSSGWWPSAIPTARVARMDLDTTGGKGAHQRILAAVDSGDVDILLGTQMIAKGLDFPQGDAGGGGGCRHGAAPARLPRVGAHLPAAGAGGGRAGRGPRGGRVIVQTRSPAHHALTFAAAHDTDGFAAAELELRRSPAYPPFVSLVNFMVVIGG